MTVAELIAKLQEMPPDTLVTAMDEHTDLPFQYKGDIWSLHRIGLRDGKWWWVVDSDPEWQEHTFDEVRTVLVVDPAHYLD